MIPAYAHKQRFLLVGIHGDHARKTKRKKELKMYKANDRKTISETNANPLQIVLDAMKWSENAAETMTAEEWKHLHDNDPRKNDTEIF